LGLAFAKMSSRLIKVIFQNGVKRAINMNNVLNVERNGVNILIQYNVSNTDSAGFLVAGCGFHLGGSKLVSETLHYQSEKEADEVFEKLTKGDD
jgi:hypothetical protein